MKPLRFGFLASSEAGKERNERGTKKGEASSKAH
jgi:hypothetical protein